MFRQERICYSSYNNVYVLLSEVENYEKTKHRVRFLLLGLIFAVPADSMLWWIGATLGIIGLIIVVINAKENN